MERKSGRGSGEGGRERGGGVGERVKQGEERVHSHTGHTHGCAGSFSRKWPRVFPLVISNDKGVRSPSASIACGV